LSSTGDMIRDILPSLVPLILLLLLLIVNNKMLAPIENKK
jgi:hypothetical protein